MDEAVLRDARAGFDRRRRFRSLLRAAGAAAAVGAAAVIVLVVYLNRPQRGGPVATVPQPLAGDVDGNGRVDILDAFLLARRLDAASGAPDRRDDVNGDGVIDRRDVDGIAAIAVRVGASGGVVQ